MAPGAARPALTPTYGARRRRQAHFQKCLDARRAVLGPGHPGTVDAVQALAAVASSREASLEILNAHVAALEAAGQANSAGVRAAGGLGRLQPGCERGVLGCGSSLGHCGCSRRTSTRASSLLALLRRSG